MRTKMDFYRHFFEQLARRGFDVKRSTSSDYLADIYYKNQLIAFYTKADTIERNPFVSVKDWLLRVNSPCKDNSSTIKNQPHRILPFAPV